MFQNVAIFGACVMFSSLFRLVKLNASHEFFDTFLKTKVGPAGERYFLIPCVLLFMFILFMLKRFLENKNEICRMKVYAGITAVIFAVGLISFSLFPRLRNFDYKADIANMYYPAPKGSVITIPINPEGYTVTLIKK